MAIYLGGSEIERMKLKNEAEVKAVWQKKIDGGYAVRVFEDGRPMPYGEAENRFKESRRNRRNPFIMY